MCWLTENDDLQTVGVFHEKTIQCQNYFALEVVASVSTVKTDQHQ